MENFVVSNDGVNIHYSVSGNGRLALVFIHGWLGNEHWWDEQKKYFSKQYTVVCLELAGHGKSGKNRVDWTSSRYAEDILAVLDIVDADGFILIGHSMSGAYALEAASYSNKTSAVVLVDTLKNMDQLLDLDQAEKVLLVNYREDFKNAVENMLPKFLFSSSTPPVIQERLQKEFLQNDSELAIRVIEPLYKMDIKNIARRVRIPVRSINCSYSPTNRESNEKYFQDYNFMEIDNSGHYPMLERPDIFNSILERILQSLTSIFAPKVQ